MTYTEALKYRTMIVKGSASLSDEDALEVPMIFDPWTAGKAYAVGDRVFYEDNLYRCEQAHTSQEDVITLDAPTEPVAEVPTKSTRKKKS